MVCTTSPSAENLISRMLRNSAVRSAAGLGAEIGSVTGISEQFALDDLADGMGGHQMDLLNDGRLVAGRVEKMVAIFAHLVFARAGEADGDQPGLARRPQRREHVRGTSRGRDRQKNVA